MKDQKDAEPDYALMSAVVFLGVAKAEDDGIITIHQRVNIHSLFAGGIARDRHERAARHSDAVVARD